MNPDPDPDPDPHRPVRRLPLLMRTVFQDVILATWAVEPDRLAAHLPAAVHPHVHGGRSYVSILVANMRGMRPAPLPETLGANAYQIVYRAVVRLPQRDGGERRGVFFLRTDCNDPLLSFFGNRMTEFRFHFFRSGSIGLYRRSDEMLATVDSADGGGDLVLHLRDRGDAEALPPSPGFASVAEEKEVLVQLFHAYAHDPEKRVLYDMEIERGDWALRRLELLDGFSAFFREGPFDDGDAEPASMLYIRECGYVWKPVVSVPDDAFVPRAVPG